MTFNRANGSKGNDAVLDLIVSNETTMLDRIRVRSGEGISMEKYHLNNKEKTHLSFCQDKQDYAVVYKLDQPSLPIQFKVTKKGTYTLSIESNLLGLDYLHLVDHITGADIDLLATPSYTFEASIDDYASRFKLVFQPTDNHDDYGDSFVDGETFIIDMAGRVVATDLNTSLAPGIYIPRTIKGNETFSKKIIIK